MAKIQTGTVLAAALALGLATAAYAAQGEFNNLCAEGLSQHKQIKTDCSINGSYQGKTYCFGSDQAKEAFMKDPATHLTKAEAFYQKEHRG
jgi:YHS domain-containing protein